MGGEHHTVPFLEHDSQLGEVWPLFGLAAQEEELRAVCLDVVPAPLVHGARLKRLEEAEGGVVSTREKGGEKREGRRGREKREGRRVGEG
jgi:hypothetical protein